MRQIPKSVALSLALMLLLVLLCSAAQTDAADQAEPASGPDPDLEPGFPVQTLERAGGYGGGQVINTVVGNIDSDPTLEILVSGLAAGPLYAFNADGTLQPGWPVTAVGGWEVVHYPALGNLGGDPAVLEVVSAVYGAETTVYDGSGAVLDGWPLPMGNVGSVALGDVNHDGLDEIFFACGGGEWGRGQAYFMLSTTTAHWSRVSLFGSKHTGAGP